MLKSVLCREIRFKSFSDFPGFVLFSAMPGLFGYRSDVPVAGAIEPTVKMGQDP